MAVEVQWADVQGERHVIVRSDQNREVEVLCGMTGTPSAPGLPCDGCREELWLVVENTLPLTYQETEVSA
jgi:hypothetical protein